MSPAWIRESADGVYLAIKLQPRASRSGVQGIHGAELKIAVTAPPVDAAANGALIELLAEKLKVARSRIEIRRGQTSRHKTIFIGGLRASDVEQLASV